MQGPTENRQGEWAPWLNIIIIIIIIIIVIIIIIIIILFFFIIERHDSPFRTSISQHWDVNSATFPKNDSLEYVECCVWWIC